MNPRYTVMEGRDSPPESTPAFHEWANDDGTIYLSFHRRSSDYLLRFPDLADFEVTSDGRDVVAWPEPETTPGTLEHLWLNQVLPLALTRQGRLVLHGSAVEVQGRGIAFLGDSGMGKSTLAASFAVGGTRFLTDDGLLLERQGAEYLIMPSHPSIRLWQDSELALMDANAVKAPAVSFTEKSRLLVGPGIAFADLSSPLTCVFFLGDEEVDKPQIRLMRPAEVLMGYVQNSFLLDADAKDLLAKQFSELSALTELPINFRLNYPRHYAVLPMVRQTIIDHTLSLSLLGRHEP